MLTFNKVSAYYGSVRVLWDVSLHVNEGEIVVVMGANGAGKTTLLKTMLGLLEVGSGMIKFGGQRIEGRDPSLISSLGIAYVPEGSIALGKRLAETWHNGTSLECHTCHGEGNRGKDDVPNIAGRSPTSIMRQLYDFKSAARRGGKSSEMEKVVWDMTEREMLALSAYLGSLRP